jgi:hypothetical protein
VRELVLLIFFLIGVLKLIHVFRPIFVFTHINICNKRNLADMKYFANGYGTIVYYILCMKVKLILLLRQKHHEDVKGVQR